MYNIYLQEISYILQDRYNATNNSISRLKYPTALRFMHRKKAFGVVLVVRIPIS